MRYLLTINIPFGVNVDGDACTDPLWAKDLRVHGRAVEELIVCAPLREGPPLADWVAIPRDASIRFIGLPSPDSFVKGLASWGRTRRILGEAMRSTDVVQLNVAGWPIPIGAIALRPGLESGALLVTAVESAPWRGAKGLWARARAAFLENRARRCVRAADLAFFTHQGYQDSLGDPKKADRYHVVSATWIDEDSILGDESLERLMTQRRGPVLKLLFAARLVKGKGTESVERLVRRLGAGSGIKISVIGEGPERPGLEALSASCQDAIEVLSPLDYGPSFFAFLRGYDLVFVPTVTDEQPRIIFDAYSQGVPVLCSDTPGNRGIVRDGETGWIFDAGNDDQLCEILLRLAAHREEIERCGREAIRVARTSTHSRMHAERLSLITRRIEDRAK